jgi:hypothetical protein
MFYLSIKYFDMSLHAFCVSLSNKILFLHLFKDIFFIGINGGIYGVGQRPFIPPQCVFSYFLTILMVFKVKYLNHFLIIKVF